MNADTVLAITAMALATYVTRVAGFALGGLVPQAGRGRAALDALPVAVLTALVAPAVLSGRAEMAAAAVTLLVALRLPTILAVAAGIVTVAVMRGVGG